MKAIEDAPKDTVILLYVESFDCFTDSWWVGQWSYSNDCWVIRTPTMVGGKYVTVSGFNVLGWEELPT